MCMKKIVSLFLMLIILIVSVVSVNGVAEANDPNYPDYVFSVESGAVLEKDKEFFDILKIRSFFLSP